MSWRQLRLRSRRGLLVGRDGVRWVQLSSKPALFVDGLHEQVQVTAHRILGFGRVSYFGG